MEGTQLARAFGLTFFLVVSFARADSAFEFLSREEGVTVEVNRGGDRPVPQVRATSELAASTDRIAQVLTQFSRYGEIFSECWAKADVLEASPKSARLHVVWRYPFFFRNRDSINRYEFKQVANGTYLLTWREDAKPGDPEEGVRLQYVEGKVELRPISAKKSLVTYTFLGDLGGDFSNGVREAAWKRQPLHYFQALAKELAN